MNLHAPTNAVAIDETTSTTSVQEIFDARSVAVIGASDDIGKIAGKPLKFLRDGPFTGEVYAVNPTRETVQGQPAYASVAAIGKPVDLAIIAVPAKRVRDAVRDCIENGVKSAVIFAGGMAETGEAGRAEEAEIRALAATTGLRLLGPNCMGLMNIQTGLYATFSNTVQDVTDDGRTEGIAVVSQSGALGNFMLTRALDAGIPVTRWIATGNEIDIEFAEALEAALDAPGVRGVLAYLEGARNGPRLRTALEKARAMDVPVALIKVGTTETGAAAVRSHTDALVGDDTLYDALFRETGAIRVSTIDELLELGRVFASGVRVTGRRLLLTSISGGVGVIMAEAATMAGLVLPGLSEQAGAALKRALPFMTPANPLDVTGQAAQDFSILSSALDIGIADTEANVVISFIGRIARQPEILARYLDGLDEMKAAFPKTIIVTAGMLSPEVEALFRERGHLAFGDPSRAVWAVSVLARQGEASTRGARETPDLAAYVTEAPTDGVNEKQGYDLLARIGIGVPDHCVVTSVVEARAAAEEMRGRLAMKVLSSDIAHKSDIGGVCLNLTDPNITGQSFTAMIEKVREAAPNARIQGALVSRMEADFAELVIGAKTDPQLGASVMVGLGGIFVEVLEDVSVRLAPVSVEEAKAMILELKGAPILTGVRGRIPRDLDAAADAIAHLSRFAAANVGWLSSVEINPFAVAPEGQGGKALDCAVALNEGDAA